MPFKILKGSRLPIKVFVKDLSTVESGALDQLRNVANLPWVEGISAMPDVHWGTGATVGSVIVQKDVLSPTVIGVDIGCGMIAVKTSLKASQLKNLPELRSLIEKSIPVGFNWHNKVKKEAENIFTQLLKSRHSFALSDTKILDKSLKQLGTLGGGNHFIELCLETKGEDPDVWVMLHSGSRNIGKETAEWHIDKAILKMSDLRNKYGDELNIPKELAGLIKGTPEFDTYVTDLFWCQRYAKANRDLMMMSVLKDISHHVFGDERSITTPIRVDCHHNYVSEEDTPFGVAMVTRKGAVSAKAGELGIIPGSMGQKSFIVRGLGNPDSFNSCSHGAGRRMSRRKAKKSFTVEDIEKQTAGVECRKDVGIIDEIPGAYKDIDEVIEAQNDVVEVVAEIKQILCVKG